MQDESEVSSYRLRLIGGMANINNMERVRVIRNMKNEESHSNLFDKIERELKE